MKGTKLRRFEDYCMIEVLMSFYTTRMCHQAHAEIYRAAQQQQAAAAGSWAS